MTERPRADRPGASEGREPHAPEPRSPEPQGPGPSAADDGPPPRRTLEEGAEQESWQSAGQPEREKRAEPSPRRRRRPRRAVRGGTNPSAQDVPDVVAPRDAPAPGETQHDRWLREQRPPHWE